MILLIKKMEVFILKGLKSILLIFTKKYFSMVLIAGDKPQPDLPQKATDAQKVATWTPFQASTGTYEVKGNTYTARSKTA